MNEEWRDVVGYEGLYQVSNLGNVKSLNYQKRGYAQNLVLKRNRNGRLWVELLKNGNRKCLQVHRLVGIAFIPNPKALPQINHKDENPANNNVDNLEWCDQSYNVRYSLERHPERKRTNVRNLSYPTGDLWHQIHKGHPGRRGKQNTCGSCINTGTKVVQYTDATDYYKVWNSVYEASKENNWRSSSIKECCEGKRKTAYGFKWRYAI